MKRTLIACISMNRSSRGVSLRSALFTALLLAPLAALNAAEPATKPAWGDQGDGTYRNPILWADYNNPCVFKAGGTFYLTCASHHFMGMPLLASKDLRRPHILAPGWRSCGLHVPRQGVFRRIAGW
jgi:hypothetical protein